MTIINIIHNPIYVKAEEHETLKIVICKTRDFKISVEFDVYKNSNTD